MALAFIFPGQGSQYVGMAHEMADAFPASKEILQRVDDALGEKLSALMKDGPIETLTLTQNAQPALMAASMAAMAALKSEFGVDVTAAKYVAGHSLGEYSALCAAGVLEVEETAKLLRIRGNAMQDAVPAGAGAMAALLGATPEDADAACSAGSKVGICEVANDNATGQIVISGEKDAVAAAAEYAQNNGVKRAMMLNVSAPFHCAMMAPAADVMKEALAGASFNAPVVPVVNNVTAGPVSDPEQLRQNLVDQVTGRVRWRESVQWMAGEGGIERFAEPGAGKVLTVMLKRIVSGVSGDVLDTPGTLENFAKSL